MVMISVIPPREYSFGRYLNDLYDEYRYPTRSRYVDTVSNLYKTNWGDNMIAALKNADKVTGFRVEDLAHVIADESSFNKYAKNNGHVGPFQMSQDKLVEMYGPIDGVRIYKEYRNGTRSDDDIIRDSYDYLKKIDNNIKTERDKLTYGRFKINQYAPNSALDEKVSRSVWNDNISKEMGLRRLDPNLKYGQATYRDIMNSYDSLNKNTSDLFRENGYTTKYKSGGIHINPKNEGNFTEAANRAGMGVQEYARHILANRENYSPTMVRRANFARNASKWKHADGGDVPPFKSFDDWYRSIYHNANDTTDYNLRRAYELAPIGELEAWRSDPDKNHLHTGYWNGDVYEFMKSKDHPTVNYELDWYNSPDADDFRSRYMLDTTTGNYKYVPRYKVKVTF